MMSEWPPNISSRTQVASVGPSSFDRSGTRLCDCCSSDNLIEGDDPARNNDVVVTAAMTALPVDS
jgi:hypothetical protein